jgi:solute carrier family 25 (mitochondrial phosphate transporter), member 3
MCSLFKPLTPLWGRQIPYTMMKFAAFENVVNALYASVVPKPKSECSKTEQLGVSFAAGYIAGASSSLQVFRSLMPRCHQMLNTRHINVGDMCSSVHRVKAGCIAVGILCALVSQPADNLVSKLSANPNATIASVTAEMGVVGLFTRGLGLRIVMVGTLTGLQWGIYDAYKAYVGLFPSLFTVCLLPSFIVRRLLATFRCMTS